MGFSTGGPIRLKLFSAEGGRGGTSHAAHQAWSAMWHPPSPPPSLSTLAPSPPRTSLLPAWSTGTRLEGWLLPSAAQHKHTLLADVWGCPLRASVPFPPHCPTNSCSQHCFKARQVPSRNSTMAAWKDGSKPRAGSSTLCSHSWSDLKAQKLTSVFLPLLLFSLLLNLLNYLLVIFLGIRA